MQITENDIEYIMLTIDCSSDEASRLQDAAIHLACCVGSSYEAALRDILALVEPQTIGRDLVDGVESALPLSPRTRPYNMPQGMLRVAVAPLGDHLVYNENSPLLGKAPPDWQGKATSYILSRSDARQRRANGYTDDDVHTIVGYYADVCQPVGLDPVLCVAQMIHETGGLTSWWSQRPRRNPSGYGVTGKSRNTDPCDALRWIEVEHGRWIEGCSFPNWKIGIEATAGRLLAYATPVVLSTPEQKRLVRLADSWRPISGPIINSAKELRALGAVHNPRNAGLPRNKWKAGWAWPGPEYGIRLANIAM